jgi:hypothetical protein
MAIIAMIVSVENRFIFRGFHEFCLSDHPASMSLAVQPHFLHLTTQAWGSGAGRTPVMGEQTQANK